MKASRLACVVLALATMAARPPDIAIVGGTVVDVAQHEGAPRDRDHVVVLIRGDRIRAIMREGAATLAPGTIVVDAHGRYVVPGLIDGYGAMRNQSFADAYLYEGVTTVVVPLAPADGGEGEGRVVAPPTGPAVLAATPVSGHSPTGSIPSSDDWRRGKFHGPALSATALSTAIAGLARRGDRIVWAAPDLAPDQLRATVASAHRHGMAVVAEQASASYDDALRAGVDVFARNDHYGAALASPVDFAAYAADPMGPGARAAMRTICGDQPFADAARRFGNALAISNTKLMPALSMEATADDVGGPNPWSVPSSIFVSPADVDDPVDPVTGARPYLASHPDRADAIRRCAMKKQDLDRDLAASGATYVAGSSTPGYGVLPGAGLHGEIKLLQRIGLTPRAALAAATANAAAAFRLADRGHIVPGALADILVLDRDPRLEADAVDDIDTVVFHGRVVDRTRLLDAARRHRKAVLHAT